LSTVLRANYDTPWKTHFDEMARKTVLKDALSKWGPLSVQMQRASVIDQGVVKDIDADVEYIDNNGTEVPAPEFKKRGGKKSSATAAEAKAEPENPPPPADDQAPGAEVGVASHPETPAEAQSPNKPAVKEHEPIPLPSQDLPDSEQIRLLLEGLRNAMAREGITEEVMMAHLIHLKTGKAGQKLADLSMSKLRNTAIAFEVHANSIKNAPAQ